MDRDNVYGDDFGSKLAGAGIREVRTPYRAPLANAVAERVVRTLRQECLDHVIVLNERHLLALCSRSSCAITTMIVLIAPSSWRRRCQVRRYRMAKSLADRSWVDFTTSMRGRHERCTFTAQQRMDLIRDSVRWRSQIGGGQSNCSRHPHASIAGTTYQPKRYLLAAAQ